jgi:hypothetical protein
MPTAPQLQFEVKLRDDLSGQLSMYEKVAAITAAFLARDDGLLCPGCHHHETTHVAGTCYVCGPTVMGITFAGYCGWTPRGGRWIDLNWTRDWYVHPEDAWWEH